MTIESPCTKVCVIEPTSGFCFGCGRTGEEIGAWTGYSPEQRRAVMAGLVDRLASLSGKPGRDRRRPVFTPEEV